MTFDPSGPQYAAVEQEAWAKNIEAVHRNPAKRREAVEKNALRMGLSPEVLWYHLATNSVYAATFAKDPTKQSIHQRTAASWIRSLPLISGFETLDPNGSDALYLYKGQVLKKANLVNDDHTKSLDFHWHVVVGGQKLLDCYATHKFTRISGGSQDNQFKDVKLFAEHARQLQRNTGVRLVMLCDGEYYQAPEYKDESKIAYLNRQFAAEFARAMMTKDLPHYMVEVVQAEAERRHVNMTADDLASLARLCGGEGNAL